MTKIRNIKERAVQKLPGFLKFVIIFCVVFFVGTGFTGALEIRLASSLPHNSDWGIILDQVAADWQRITNGEVTLTIFHQRAGTEEQFLQWLKQNRFQAAVFTSEAFYTIAPEIMALSIPFLIRTNEEFDAVLQEVRPLLDTKIEENGFIPLAWAKGGFVKIFSRSPVLTPDDLKRLKLGISPSNTKLADAFKTMGFQIVGASMSDIPAFLASGRIDAIYQSPIYVQTSQFYKVVGNMSSFNLAPFMGGVLMNKQGWESIPARYRDQLREIVRQAGVAFENSFQKREAEAIEIMRRDGVNYVEVNPQAEQVWMSTLQPQIAALAERGIFNKEMYLRIQGILQRRQGAR
jgi:TRAP-type C4-dicarboxylate transport system substrate-binding protein